MRIHRVARAPMPVTRGESDEIFLEIDGSTLNTLRINEPVSRNIMRYYKSVNGRRCVCGRDIKAGLVSEFVMGFVRGRGGALSTKLSRHSLVGAADWPRAYSSLGIRRIALARFPCSGISVGISVDAVSFVAPLISSLLFPRLSSG